MTDLGTTAADTLVTLGVTHVVWLPDSSLGAWEKALEARDDLKLVRVCREGEAWAIAAGLFLGGARPIVVIQSTGFFESGDAMRNVLFDMQLPLYAIVGYRSYLLDKSTDTAKQFLEPIINAWGLDQVLLDGATAFDQLVDHFTRCRDAGRPGIALWAEGKG